jgi:NTP pyrophosphohydrolases including oxidative damage repair enzymes
MTKQWLTQTLNHSPPRELDPTDAGDAAIAIVISGARAPELTLCIKASHLRTHAGEVSFPGGRRDPRDDDLLDTACRELDEETGLRLDRSSAVGRLGDLQSLHGLRVRPWVFFSEEPLAGMPCELEIAQVLQKPIRAFQDQVPTIELSTHRTDQRIRMPRWSFSDVVVWGLTALFIEDLLAVLAQGPAKP